MSTDTKAQLLHVRTGGCLCGAVRCQVTGPPLHVYVCHCDSCRRATGSVMVAWGTWPAARLAIRAGALAGFESSPGVTREHCARCGTSITYRNRSCPGEVDLTLASLGDPPDLVPTAHIWVADRVPWLLLNDGLPQYAGSAAG